MSLLRRKKVKTVGVFGGGGSGDDSIICVLSKQVGHSLNLRFLRDLVLQTQLLCTRGQMLISKTILSS